MPEIWTQVPVLTQPPLLPAEPSPKPWPYILRRGLKPFSMKNFRCREKSTTHSILISYVPMLNLISSTSFTADLNPTSPPDYSYLHGNGNQVSPRQPAVHFESLLRNFYWECRRLKELPLFPVHFYDNKTHSNDGVGIIIKPTHISMHFRWCSVVIKMYSTSLGCRRIIVKAFLLCEINGRMYKTQPTQGFAVLWRDATRLLTSNSHNYGPRTNTQRNYYSLFISQPGL